MRQLKEIIIHCSATEEGKDFTAEDIRKWHKERGFIDIGYHYVIRLDGSVEVGRPLDQIGAHVKGRNANSIGICYIGGLDYEFNPKDTRTKEQRQSMIELIDQLKKTWPEIIQVSGHNEYSSKSCPCFNVKTEL